MMVQQKHWPILAGIFLAVVALIVFSQMSEESLLASVFGGGGLTDGLDAAKQEVSGSGVRTDGDLIDSILAIINFTIDFVAIFALVAFVVSGFIFILGFGSDQANQRAKKIMIWAAVGLLVILFSVALTRFIGALGTGSTSAWL